MNPNCSVKRYHRTAKSRFTFTCYSRDPLAVLRADVFSLLKFRHVEYWLTHKCRGRMVCFEMILHSEISLQRSPALQR